MCAVSYVGIYGALKAIISESILDYFPMVSVFVSENEIKFNTYFLFCQL